MTGHGGLFSKAAYADIISWNASENENDWLWVILVMRQRAVETFSSVPSLSRRWRDHFYDLSTSRLRAGLRIPLDRLGAAVSPADKS